MTIRAQVVRAWQQLTRRERRIIRQKSIRSGAAGCRFRCKIITGLARGRTPAHLAAGGLCAASQVYRVAHLFLTEGLRGRAEVLPFDTAVARTIFRRYFGPDEERWDPRFREDIEGETGVPLIRFTPETIVMRCVPGG